MALSGSFTGSTNNQFIEPKITWSATQDVTNNTSTVTAILTYSRTNSGYTTSGTWSGTITINGTESSASKSISITQNSNTEAIRATVTVPHNADGTKSITISATGGIKNTTFSSTTISASVTLNTIPRASTIKVGALKMGTVSTITITRASSSFTHKLTYDFGTKKSQTSGLSASSGIATSATFTPPTSLATEIPNAVSSSCKITCTTMSGSTTIGTSSVTVTLSVPDSMVPTISNVAVSEAVSSVAQFGVYVQGLSKLAVSVSGSGSGGATVTYSSTFGGKTYSGASFTTDLVNTSGNLVVTAKDSRGRTASKTVAVAVTPYSAPRLSNINIFRCDSTGERKDNGTYIYFQATASVADINGKNLPTMKARWANASGSSAEYTLASGVAQILGDGGVYITNTYTAYITLSDTVGKSDTYSVVIPTDLVTFNARRGGDGFAFGKYNEREGFECAWDSFFEGDMEVDGSLKIGGHSTPVGSIVDGSSTAAVSIATGTWKTLKSISLPAGTWHIDATANFANQGAYGVAICLATSADTNALDARSFGQAAYQLHVGAPFSLTATTTIYLNALQYSGSAMNVTPRLFKAVRNA